MNRTFFNAAGLADGTYNKLQTYKLYYKDVSTGCIVFDSVNMTIVPKPYVDLSFDPLADSSKKWFCLGESDIPLYTRIGQTPSNMNLAFGDTVPSSSTYSYFFGPNFIHWGPDLNSSSGNNAIIRKDDPLVTPTNGGYQWLLFIYSQSAAGVVCSNRDSVQARIDQPLTLSLTNQSPICAYTPSVKVGYGVTPAGFTALWSDPGGGSFNDVASSSADFTPSAAEIAAGSATVHAMTNTVGLTACTDIEDSTVIAISFIPVDME